MEIRPREIVYYETSDGKVPFLDWLQSTKGHEIKKAIRERFKRIEQGNLGDHKHLQNGVFEFRLLGPGIRVYYAEVNDIILIILWGGGKNTPKDQGRDLARAEKYWIDFQERLDEE